MTPSRGIIFRALDSFLLLTVFIAQSVILSQYTVYSDTGSEAHHCIDPKYQKLLWLLGDLICITFIALASFLGFRHLKRRWDNDEPHPPPPKITILGYISSDKFPLCYISWFLYATLLIVKICVIFTSSGLHEKLMEQETIMFGSQFLQLGIALTAIIFSLLVEAHHDTSRQDPKRNAYLNSVAFEIALEVLDTAALLSFLIPSFEHLNHHVIREETCPAASFTAGIITLAAFNLLLPTIILFKLTTTGFGEVYNVKLEMLYKFLHLVLVNLPFFIVRMHLWNIHDREEVIFSIKNLYGIVGFFRGIHSDFQLLREEQSRNRSVARRSITPRNRREGSVASAKEKCVDEENAVEMKTLMNANAPVEKE